MTLTIDLTPTEEAQLAAAAQQENITPGEAAHRLLTTHLPSEEPSAILQQSASGLLRGWLRDEATNDPFQVQKAQEDLDEFKRNLNANRAATGERLLFPE